MYAAVVAVLIHQLALGQDAAPTAPVETAPVEETAKPPEAAADAPAVKADAPAAVPPKEAPAPHVEERHIKSPTEVSSAFEYSAQRAWFNGTKLLGAGLYYQGSYLLGSGGYVRGLGQPGVQMNGFRIVERHGIISALLMKVLTGALALLAIMGSAEANTNTYYNGYYTDGGRTFVVTGYTVTQTAEQRDRFNADVADANKMVEDVGPGQMDQHGDDFRSGLWTDLAVYDPNVALFNKTAPSASGYDLTFGGDFGLATLFGLPVVLDVGLNMANIRSPRDNRGKIGPDYYEYRSFGVLGRVHVPLSKFVTFSLDWTFNFNVFGYAIDGDKVEGSGQVFSCPLRANLEVHLTDRFFARGSAVLGGFGFTDGKVGLALEAGMRL